eukprot:3925963-Lingulodinium_polyedra.AAC.1
MAWAAAGSNPPSNTLGPRWLRCSITASATSPKKPRPTNTPRKPHHNTPLGPNTNSLIAASKNLRSGKRM